MSRFALDEPRPGCLVLSGELTIYDAAHIKDELVDRMAANVALEVDLSEVSEMDTAGVQLLLMLSQEAERTNKPLKWLAHSHAVVQVLERLNLRSALGAPAELVWT